jgi:outer membrane receptor protein involved in Fe transport
LRRADAKQRSGKVSNMRSVNGWRPQILASVSITALLCMGQAALADDAPSQVESVVVSASRIARDGFEAPTPTTVVSREDIDKKAPSNLADYVNEIPALAPTTTPATTTVGIGGGTGGANLLNLRDLGVTRTLTLLDGRRFVPSVITGAVDVNQLPTGLIQRVDVVTGGASAAWGSDAVAGVVNFVLDKKFTGFKMEGQGGLSTLGDDANGKIDATYGTDFLDGKGHFLVDALYSKDDGIGTVASRAGTWFKGYKIIANPAHLTNPSAPANIVAPNVGVSVATPNGLIVDGPLRGTQFGAGGATSPFTFGTPPNGIVSGILMLGGTPNDLAGYAGLMGSLEEQNIFTRASYDIRDDLTVYTELSYARSTADNNSGTYFVQGTQLIQPDNAYVLAAGLTPAAPFHFGTNNAQFPTPVGHNTRTTMRIVVGADGAIGNDWTWHAYYQYGVSDVLNAVYNDTMKSKYNLAVDAVNNGGTIQCRSVAVNPACVPLDVFGSGVASKAAIAYVDETATQFLTIHENVAAADLNGTLFDDWAGPVSLATGVEYRSEQMVESADAESVASDLWLGNYKPSQGKYTVAEGFIETDIPLLKDAFFAKFVDLDLAGRFTDYSTSGDVQTYKAGLSWQATDDLRFRATQSRDIRAPNLSDLFLGGQSNTQTVMDPTKGNATSTVLLVTTGNTALTPEIAETHSAGVVYRPSWLPGFNTSIDWYRIGIAQAITTLPIQTIVNDCFTGLTQFCSAIVRDGGGNITSIKNIPFNAQALKTSGLDFEAGYDSDLTDIVSGWPGTMSLRLLATRVNELQSQLSGKITNTLGEVVQGGIPKWRATFDAGYTWGPSSTVVTMRFTGPGVLDNTYTPAFINRNTVSSAMYVDLSETYALQIDGIDSELFAVVDNLFDKDPPVAPAIGTLTFSSFGTTGAYYDVIGRSFRAGFRIKF